MNAKQPILICAGYCFVVVLLILFCGYFFLSPSLLSLTETKDMMDVESPDHLCVATGYHVLGGATDADSTIIVVHAKGQSYLDSTNRPILIADNLEPFHLSWSQNRELSVECSLVSTYLKKDGWRDVTVRYVEK